MAARNNNGPSGRDMDPGSWNGHHPEPAHHQPQHGDDSGAAAVQHPTSQVAGWAQGFHTLMSDERGRNELVNYLKQEQSNEFGACIKFWLAWVGFKHRIKDPAFKYDGQTSWKFAAVTVRFFVRKRKGKSCDRIDLSEEVTRGLEEKWNILEQVPNKSLTVDQILDMFQDPFYEVEDRLKNAAHPNFIQSDWYIRLLNQEQEIKSHFMDSQRQDDGSARDPAINNNNVSNSWKTPPVGTVQQQQVAAAAVVNHESDHHYQQQQQQQQLLLKENQQNQGNILNNNKVKTIASSKADDEVDPILNPAIIERNSRAANSVFKSCDHTSLREYGSHINNNNFINNSSNNNSQQRAISINNNDPDFPTRIDVDFGSSQAATMSKRRNGSMTMATLPENMEVRIAANNSSSTRPVPLPRSSYCSPDQQQQQQSYPTLSMAYKKVPLPTAASTNGPLQVVPPNPYHVSYNPKLPPSANDSEINSRVSAASLSDVDYSLRGNEPISAKELKRVAQKSKTSANQNCNIQPVVSIPKILPQPIRPGAAAAAASAASSSSATVPAADRPASKGKFLDLRTLASQEPILFADEVISRLLRFERDPKLMEDFFVKRNRSHPSSLSQAHDPPILDAVNAVASKCAQLKSGADQAEAESSEAILEDHLNTLIPEWGRTPDRSGRQSPSRNRSSSNRRTLTLPRNPHHHQAVDHWMNPHGGGAAAGDGFSGAAGGKCKSHSVHSSSSSKAGKSKASTATNSGYANSRQSSTLDHRAKAAAGAMLTGSGSGQAGNLIKISNRKIHPASFTERPMARSMGGGGCDHETNVVVAYLIAGSPNVEKYKLVLKHKAEGVRLRQFKEEVRLHTGRHQKFYFRVIDPVEGDVYELIQDDNAILPVYDLRIDARVQID